jgi:aryl-alcohol dehydrogenase-like predicted oxidoreductase
MEYRQLGRSGLKVPELCFGAGTLGSQGEFFEAWAKVSAEEGDQIIGTCMDAGLNFFDTADIYSYGSSETALGKALSAYPREKVLISTKATFRFGDGPNDVGSNRYHLIQSLERSLRRLNTDYIDVYHLHAFDALTPIEETLNTLDKMVREGKVRYIACSNFSGWHLMKSLSISERYGWARYVGHQVYYSLVGRDYEWELMPLALDQGVGALVWSPLGWGRLTGRIRRETGIPKDSRLNTKMVSDAGPQVPEEYLYQVVDALDEIAKETGKTVPQIALNWLLSRPTVSTLIIGARNLDQLKANLGAVGWKLTPKQIATLDAASAQPKAYPYWHQNQFSERNPFPVG